MHAFLERQIARPGDTIMLVAHNGQSFDVPFIQAALLSAGVPQLQGCQLLDTVLLSRQLFGSKPAAGGPEKNTLQVRSWDAWVRVEGEGWHAALLSTCPSG